MAEGHSTFGEHLIGEPVCAGIEAAVVRFPVKDDGVGDVIVLEEIHAVLGFLHGLLLVDGLGEEVHPNFNVVFQGTLQIGLKVGVRDNPPRSVPTVTQTDHGEVHASVLHSGPIDLPLVAGDVDADPVIIVIAVVGEEPVFIHLEEGGIIGPFWHFFHHIDLFVAEVEVIPLLLGCVGVLW